MALPLSAPKSKARKGLEAPRLGIRGYALRIPGRALWCDALQVTTLAEGIEGIDRDTLGSPPFLNNRPHIRCERILQEGFRFHQVRTLLRISEIGMADEAGLCKEFLRHGNGLKHRLDLSFQIVALINHVSDVGRFASLPLVEKNFMKDTEDLVGVDGAKSEIVIGVAAIVEMESTQQLLRKKPGDDLFDVLRGVMMAGIHQNF